jgi:antitoxin (DNA-binding transcriptional repressor) of toxin-antitoxin stability system
MRLNASVTEVARHFADYINRVAFRGERFILMRGNKPVAGLTPVPAGRYLSELPTLLASLPRLSSEEASAFAEDLEAARREMAEQPLHDPWAS